MSQNQEAYSNIYDGTTGPISGSTPFGYYDDDISFQNDGPKVAKYVAIKLGYPMSDVELDTGSIYTAFEEAITIYGNEIYQNKIKENYLSLEGNSTGSSLNNALIQPNLGTTIRLSKTYGAEIGTGGDVTHYSGSLVMNQGEQNYDLNTWASASASLDPYDSIEIKKIFYERPPALVRYFDPYAGTGTGLQSLIEAFDFGKFSPGVNFMLMPINYDLQKFQAIEFNDEIRRSGYSFELVNNKLKIFPIPPSDSLLRFEYVKVSERNNVFKNQNQGLITNQSQVPYNNPNYSQINSPGRRWIFDYTVAMCREMLGLIRSKYSNIPIPGSEVTLNGSSLIELGGKEKESLITKLRDDLDKTSRKTLLENQASEADSIMKSFSNVPLLIYVG